MSVSLLMSANVTGEGRFTALVLHKRLDEANRIFAVEFSSQLCFLIKNSKIDVKEIEVRSNETIRIYEPCKQDLGY